MIVAGNDGTQYFISIPQDSRIDLNNAESKLLFKKYVRDKRASYIKKGFSNAEAIDKTWEEIAQEKGWHCGKK